MFAHKSIRRMVHSGRVDPNSSTMSLHNAPSHGEVGSDPLFANDPGEIA